MNIGRSELSRIWLTLRWAVLILCAAAGCGSVEYRSHWRNQEIAVDGRNVEWRDSLTYLLEDRQSSIGFMNDDRDLYVCLISANHDLERQAMRPGLTVWFDRDGGEDKKFGIHYPVRSGGPRTGTQPGGQDDPDRSAEFQNEGNSSDANELEILGPGEGDRRRMTMMEATGIEVRSRMTNDLLVYEMKIPLAESGSRPFGIGTKPGSIVGIGVEVIRNQEGRRPPEGSSERGEGFGGGYGTRRGGGGRGGGGRGGRGENSAPSGQPEQFKLWAKVSLASQETSTR